MKVKKSRKSVITTYCFQELSQLAFFLALLSSDTLLCPHLQDPKVGPDMKMITYGAKKDSNFTDFLSSIL